MLKAQGNILLKFLALSPSLQIQILLCLLLVRGHNSQQQCNQVTETQVPLSLPPQA